MGRRSPGRADSHASRLRIEALEPRLLLSATTPTAYDQYLLELVNRARADPAAEAARYGISLNEGLPAGTISSDPKQPLAMNPDLLDSARQHTQWMIDTDTFSHTGAGGSDPGDRMAAAGYEFDPPWSWGENLAMFRQTPTVPPMDTGTAQLHQNLFVDSGVDGRGHRLNLMDPDFKEVGTAVLPGDWGGWNAVVCTEDFAYSGDESFLTGVAYDDDVTHDSFYTPGEGLGGVSIVATNLSSSLQYTATTWASGGYSLALPAGTYDVVASGGGLAGPITIQNIVIGLLNVKQDFTPAMVPTPPDLQVTALAAPNGTAGTAIAVPTTVRNAGTLATGAGFTVSYYLSTNATWDASDRLLGATGNARPALAAGSDDTFTAHITLPADASGSLYIIAYADWDGSAGAIAESDEANNTRADAATIHSVGLLQAPWPANPSAVLIGQPFAFDFSSSCEGQGEAAYSLVAGPSWLTLDAETGALSGTPSRRADIGSAQATIRVDDGLGGTDECTFELDVQGQVIRLGSAGASPSPGQPRATFTDAAGNRVTASLRGKTGTVYLVRAVAPDAGGDYSNAAPGDLCSIEAEGTSAGTGIAFAATPAVRGQAARTAVGEVLVDGSLASFTAPMLDLQGDLTISGSIGRLTLGNVGNGSAGASPSLSIGSDPAILATTLAFGQVHGAAIQSDTPIKSLTAIEWLAAVATSGSLVAGASGEPLAVANTIAAPWLGALAIKGKQGAIRGDFEASLDLSGSGNPRQATLGSAAIAGQLAAGAWEIQGDAGAIKAASVESDWSLDAAGIVKGIEGTASLAATVQAKAILKVSTAGALNASLTLTGDDGRGVSLGTLRAGSVGDATVGAAQGISAISVASWQEGSISAAWIGTLSVTGNARLHVSGDFGADVSLSAAGNPQRTLGRAAVAGTLADAAWTVSGAVGTLDVGWWGAGSVVAVGVEPGDDGVYFGADDQPTGGSIDSLAIRQFDSSYGTAFGVTAPQMKRVRLLGKPVAVDDLPFSQGDFRIVC